ncbi:hypothetical protein FSB84_21805 [Pseudobacter ginsenosidimutans]|nr:hypothetical protein FSB84_21805 [Pseudobacter ginsenosidimutans]
MQQEHRYTKHPSDPAKFQQCKSSDQTEQHTGTNPQVHEERRAADHDITISGAHGAGA